MDRNLALELVRVTEAAALVSSQFMGRGDKDGADGAAVEAMRRAFESVKMDARRYGVNVTGSEVVGLCPMEALVDVAAYYLGLEDFTLDKVLETSLME